jgi:anti-sigma B factor antagonist
MSIQFVEKTHGDVTELALDGQLSAGVEEQMMAKNEELLALGRIRLVIDLAALKFIDSSGIGALVSLFKRVRSQKGDVKIAALAGQPREIFKLLKLDKAFEVYDSTDLALKSFQTPAP